MIFYLVFYQTTIKDEETKKICADTISKLGCKHQLKIWVK